MLQFTGQAKDLDSTVTPVVNWGAVVVGGMKAGADIAKTQADTRVDELRGQVLEEQMPVIAEQAGVALYNLSVEKEQQAMQTTTERAKTLFEKKKADDALELSQTKNNVALAEKQSTILATSALINTPGTDMYKAFESATVSLRKDGATGFKKANAWAKTLPPNILNTPEGVKLVKDLQEFGTAQEVEVVYPTGERGRMTAYAADQQGLDYLTEKTLSPLEKSQIDSRNERAARWAKIGSDAGEKDIAAYVNEGLDYDQKVVELGQKAAEFKLKNVNIAQTIAPGTELTFIEGMDDPSADFFVQTKKIEDSITDPTKKIMYKMAVRDALDDAREAVLNLSISSAKLQKRQIDSRSEVSSQAASGGIMTGGEGVVPSGKKVALIETFMADARRPISHVGDMPAYNAVKTNLEARILLVKTLYDRLPIHTEEQRVEKQAYYDSYEQLVAARNKFDNEIHILEGTGTPSWKAGREKGSKLNVLFHDYRHGLPIDVKGEKALLDMYMEADAMMPKGVSSAQLENQLPAYKISVFQNELAELQARRQSTQGVITSLKTRTSAGPVINKPSK
jgi:hypothetical protein